MFGEFAAEQLHEEEEGISEAKLVRRFLDRLLLGLESSAQVNLGRAQAALEVLESTDEIAASHRLAEVYRFEPLVRQA